MRTIFDAFGITWPDYADSISAGAALALLPLIWGASHLLARLVGPRLSRFFSHRGGRPEVLNCVWTLFEENGVVLPNSQRDIHIKDWPAPLPAEG